jgi:hypothetical protein
MNNAVRGPGCRLTGGIFWLLLVLALGFAPSAEAAKFTRATIGPIEVYSSDTPANSRRLVGELIEVRRRIQELVAPVPLPNPRLQILVFSRQKDYEEFLPEKAGWDTKTTTISGFTGSEQALVAAVVREGQMYAFGQDSLHYFYAHYLLNAAIPNAPLWVRAGLPEFFATTDYRGNNIYVGADFMDHLGNVRLGKLLPLTQLMDDEAMGKYIGASRHDNVLYHESWALWHRWLTDPDPRRKEQLQRLFAGLRAGRPGDFATVMECFGETAEAIEASRRATARGKGFPVVESNTNPAGLVQGLDFQPATPLDSTFAQALLAGGARRGPAQLSYDLLHHAEANPTSPRPAEARAILAMSEGDQREANVRWETARELGTNNPFAYLLPAREALMHRNFFLEPRSQLPERLAADCRRNLTRAVELDPGSADAQSLRLVVEAFGPQPDAGIVDEVEQSHVLPIRPQGFLYLALARWRLGQLDAARSVLVTIRDDEHASAGLSRQAGVMLDAITKSQAKAE